MKYPHLGLAIVSALIFSGCGIQFGIKPGATDLAKSPLSKPYHYAYTGVVLDAATEKPLPKFSVSVLGESAQTHSVINALGNPYGLFHIPKPGEALSLLVSAPGYDSTIVSANLNSVCENGRCEGVLPSAVLLKASSKQNLGPSSWAASELSSAGAEVEIQEKGASSLFRELVAQGKLDPALQRSLASASNATALTDIVVLLNTGSKKSNAQDIEALMPLLLSLLGGIQGGDLGGISLPGSIAGLLPIFGSLSPEIGTAMMAINLLLPYLRPIIGSIAERKPNSGIAKLLAAFLGDKDMEGGLLNLISLLGGQSQKPILNGVLQALVPFLQRRSSENQSGDQWAATNPLIGLIQGFLKPRGSQPGDKAEWEIAAPYVQALLQAFLTNEGKGLAKLLNQFLKQPGMSPKERLLKLDPNQLASGKYAELIPYLTPLSEGLKGNSAPAIEAFLKPYLKKKRPGYALLRWIRKAQSRGDQGVLQALFPGYSDLWGQGVASKQVLTFQLLQGLINGDFKDVSVVQDLEGSPGVIVSGQARDIFKMALLPNVKQLRAAH